MPDPFVGAASPLSQAAFDNAAGRLGGDPASLWSLLTVETRGFGFLPDRRPKILFERHIFHRRTNGRFSAAHPDISSPQSGGYLGNAAEYGRLTRAIELDRRAALESASWGLGQIMGFNAQQLGYADVDEMVGQFTVGEDQQLDGVVRFVASNKPLLDAFAARTWATVAFYYNGAAYAENRYDVKLAQYYEAYAAGHIPSLRVRAAQARLSYLGYEPHGVDGIMGPGTHAALLAFQKASQLPANAELDDATDQQLRTAAGV
jgi:N-acetylmuramidase-like protein/putative peptidoglycan binding protein